MTQSVSKDGQTTLTGDLNFGGFKATGLAVGTVATDAATLAQVQSGAAGLLGGAAGTNTITASANPAIAAYAAGQQFVLLPANTNTGPATLNINGAGAKAILFAGSPLRGGELRTNVPVILFYDGTQFNVFTFGKVRQTVEGTPFTTYVSSSATWTGAGNPPNLPMTNAQGVQVGTVTITPSNSSNRVVVDGIVNICASTGPTALGVGIFQDAVVDALRMSVKFSAVTDELITLPVHLEKAAGAATAITFNMRVASFAGSVLANGTNAGQQGGGTLACTLRVTEYET